MEKQVKEEHIKLVIKTIRNEKENRIVTREEAIQIIQFLMTLAEIEYEDFKKKQAGLSNSQPKTAF